MSFQPTPEEIADRYLDGRDRIVPMIDGLTSDDLSRTVPGTPQWSVHDLIGHLVGCPIDLAAGRFEGAGGRPWTQAQVEARRDVPVADLMAEWTSNLAAIEAAIRAGDVPAPVTFDILTHESDLRGAIGAEPTSEPRAIRFVADGFGARLTKAVAKVGLAPLQLRATDSDWSVGEAEAVRGEATEHEWTRALTGRRSKRQLCAYSWSGDPAPYLGVLCPFGPLPDADVEE
jgi:uncharacterized protein (TIGR03083 family)